MRNLREADRDQGEKQGERWGWLAGSPASASPGNLREIQVVNMAALYLLMDTCPSLQSLGEMLI